MMDAAFNSLKRGNRYTFVFGGGVPAVTGTFHGIGPDACLIVAGTSAGITQTETHTINAANVVYAREA